ncbi:hypothetical protein DENSPDRAFT_60616 [Dentipellis sp. KUC8613]|nr:hypothetical protein DENSPDRAFT_60616 [Dentipellis sp. KUC8613]
MSVGEVRMPQSRRRLELPTLPFQCSLLAAQLILPCAGPNDRSLTSVQLDRRVGLFPDPSGFDGLQHALAFFRFLGVRGHIPDASRRHAGESIASCLFRFSSRRRPANGRIHRFAVPDCRHNARQTV